MSLLGPAEAAIEQSPLLAVVVLLASFAVLAKCADVFVESAVGIAWRLKVPKLLIGLVLVSLATTAPELSVSLIAALRGNPEMALGNAIGSVICDDGLALGLAGVVAVAPIAVIPTVLHSSGLFLITIQVLCFLFVVFDGALHRPEGVVLVVLFVAYLTYLYRQHRSGRFHDDVEAEVSPKLEKAGMARLLILFAVALAGIIFSSELIVTSATTVARTLGVPEAVIALTLVALGTSIPEVATCVIAARKNEGAIAIGNILGADILNICWVAGASSIANDLALGRRETFFMFPSMFVVVAAMLLMLRWGYRLTRAKGAVLLSIYVLYIASFFVVYKPQLP
jgi:cation:H+ antiporter